MWVMAVLDWQARALSLSHFQPSKQRKSYSNSQGCVITIQPSTSNLLFVHCCSSKVDLEELPDIVSKRFHTLNLDNLASKVRETNANLCVS